MKKINENVASLEKNCYLCSPISASVGGRFNKKKDRK